MPPRNVRLDRNDPGWKIATFAGLVGGLNTQNPPELIADEEAAVFENVHSRFGSVEVDTGYKQQYDAVSGVPRLYFEYTNASGARTPVLITDDSAYQLGGDETWHYISSGTSTDLTANEVMGAIAIDVTSETGFSATDRIGITLDDGSQHKTTVASTAVGVINIDDPLPSAASIGNAVVLAVELSGSSNDAVVGFMVPPDEALVVTNGVDVPHAFNGVTFEPLPNLPSGGNFVAKTGLYFNDRVNFYNTTENGTRFPYRHRWSEQGTSILSGGTAWSGGGNNDLLDTDDVINAAKQVADNVLILRRNSIVLQEVSVVTTFAYRTIISGSEGIQGSGSIGVLSANAVAEIGGAVVWLSNTGVLAYGGGFSVEPLSIKVDHMHFDSTGELERTSLHRAFLVDVAINYELWVCYPSTGSTYPDRALVLDKRRGIWRKRLFKYSTDSPDSLGSREITGAGVKLASFTIPWSSLVSSWTAQTFAWDSDVTTSEMPTIMFCAADTKVVYEYDYMTAQDDGNMIAFNIQTKDFEAADFKERLDRHSFVITGDGVDFLRQVDRGLTVPTIATLSPGSLYTRSTVYNQTVSSVHNLRWRGKGGGFRLKSFSTRFREEEVQQ